MLKPGKYTVTPDRSTFKISRTKNGHEQMSMVLRTADGETAEWVQTLANDMSWEIAAKNLRTFGWVGDDLDDLSGVGTKKVDVTLVEDPKWGIQVKYVNECGQGPERKADPSAHASVRDRMRLVASGLPAVHAPPPPALTDNGEIPF